MAGFGAKPKTCQPKTVLGKTFAPKTPKLNFRDKLPFFMANSEFWNFFCKKLEKCLTD